ncbi:MAG: ABC transporter substrate-binding protein [Chloroflexota bacterium]|nr:MAG: ABC transporter substrate-binding protein [Chloroflexota bacterium]
MKKQLWIVHLILLLALGLSACGGAAAPEQQAPAESQQAAAPAEGGDQPAQAESGDAAAPKEGLAAELSVYNWADYIDEEILKNYEKEHGVKIVYDTFASNEDLLAKLQAGATGYDVIFPSDYMVAQMIELGLLAEIDHNNIPNLKNMTPFFLNAPYDPGNKHCVPYQWGTTGIAYSTKAFDTPPDSWSYLFDPEQAKKWADAGGINVLNDQRELLGSALKYLGYSLNSKDEKQLEEAKDVIVGVKPYIKTFNSEDYDDSLLIPGEVIISQAWSGDGFKAVLETTDEATGESEWDYVIPKEGAMVWQDNGCVTATSQKKATAEHFLNYLLDAEVGAAITNYTYYASPNETAKQYINKEVLDDPRIYPPEETLAKLEWAESLGETIFVYDRLWTEIKSQ